LEYEKIIFRFNLTDVIESGALTHWIKFLETEYLWSYKFHIWDEQIKSYNFAQYPFLAGVDMNFYNTLPKFNATFDTIYKPSIGKYTSIENGRYQLYWDNVHSFVDHLYTYKNFLKIKTQGEK
jgi:hypothetical protein